MSDPLRFVFGLHLHQPVGNLDRVFAEHAQDVYRPLLDQLRRRDVKPVLFHLSGPLLEWLEANDTALLDTIGTMAADGALELLLSGMYEPILATLPREDRLEQIAWHREALRKRFDAAGTGLWLTERVWEPDLAGDLADAGVTYVLVDDRHFLAAGFTREQLGVPWRTEHNGRGLGVMTLDERLRHLIPSRPAGETEAYFRARHAAGQPLVVFCDDGEKFGGWPQTRDWVYGQGWFDAFCDMLHRMQDEGVLRLVSGADAVADVPAGGIAYLPTSSYREMEAWTLPTEGVTRLRKLQADLGAERLAGPDGAFVRGSHWKNFFVKYAESNRIHKKSLALSRLCRARGDPPAARRAVARAQCNDALWHGVFGGLYLPHLRAPLWAQLAIAERELRAGETPAAETLDLDFDGADDVWVHSAVMSAVVAPSRGGALVEFTDFRREVNHVDVLTRRREPYHLGADRPRKVVTHQGVQTIHEREAQLSIDAPPPVDLDVRAIGVVRVIGADVDEQRYLASDYEPVRSWARTRCRAETRVDANTVEVRCDGDGLSVTWRFTGVRAEATYRWDPQGLPRGARVMVECSLAHDPRFEAPGAAGIWRHAIETVGKSERGLEHVVQGEGICALFDAAAGQGAIAVGV